MGIIGMWTLSVKYDRGRYRNVVTIPKMRLWALSDCGDYRNVGTIPEIRLWALSDCGDYRKVGAITKIQLWALWESKINNCCHECYRQSDCGHYRIESARPLFAIVGTIGSGGHYCRNMIVGIIGLW